MAWKWKCKCRLDAIVCNNSPRWDKNKCRCECKELIDKGVCDKGFIWNPSNGECECDKTCDVREYLDYENCKCRKKLVAPLTQEFTETVEEVKLAKITLAENESGSKCSSFICILCYSQQFLQLTLELLLIVCLFTMVFKKGCTTC